MDGYNVYEWMLLYTRGSSTSGTTATAPTTTTTTTTGNAVPVANAGADVSVPKSWNYAPWVYATKSTDSDGWITGFRWTKISGPTPYTIVSPTGNQTKLSNLVAGTYVFRVTVTDNKGATDTDDVTVTITNN